MSKYAKDIAEIKSGMATLLERSEHTVEGLKTLNGTVSTLDKQVDENCKDIARLQERQGIWAGVNTTLTLVAAAIAAWIGVQR